MSHVKNLAFDILTKVSSTLFSILNKQIGNKPILNKQIGIKPILNKQIGIKPILNKQIDIKPINILLYVIF